MINWDKILDDFARKCKGGAPDMTNPNHLALLRESLLKFGWKENITNEFIGNLREAKKGGGPVSAGFTKSKNPKPKYYFINPRPKAGKSPIHDLTDETGKKRKWKYATQQQVDVDNQSGGEEGSGETTGVSEEQQMVMDAQKETSDKRDEGVAGAGGESASQGESRYCSRLNEGKTEQERQEKDEQWEEDNATAISEEEKAIDNRKFYKSKGKTKSTRYRVSEDRIDNTKLSTEEKDVLDALGLEEDCVDTGETKKLSGTKGKVPVYDCTMPDEMKNYLAKREVCAKQELEIIKKLQRV